MTEFANSNPWVLALLGLLLGLLLGVIGARFFERRKTGGVTVNDVQREMDDYKEEVGKHFATTSELFRDMTEKYRDVYNHLATGSQELCEDSVELVRLEYAEGKSLEASDDVATDDESVVEEPVTEDAQETESQSGHDAAPTAAESSKTSETTRDDPPLNS